MPTVTSEEIRLGQISVRFLVDGPATGASLTLFEFEVGPEAKVPAAHSHDAYDETVYGLEGILTMTLNGVPTEIGPGDFLFVPRGVVHRFDNLHATTSRSLAVISPGILGSEYFREIAVVMKSSAGGPPNLQAIAEVMLRHGLTPAP